LYLIYILANFENFSPDTLKMADILRYAVRYGKCEWGVNWNSGTFLELFSVEV